jgi:hypothetical protein
VLVKDYNYTVYRRPSLGTMDEFLFLLTFFPFSVLGIEDGFSSVGYQGGESTVKGCLKPRIG